MKKDLLGLAGFLNFKSTPDSVTFKTNYTNSNMSVRDITLTVPYSNNKSDSVRFYRGADSVTDSHTVNWMNKVNFSGYNKYQKRY
jgi:hypothetical protein